MSRAGMSGQYTLTLTPAIVETPTLGQSVEVRITVDLTAEGQTVDILRDTFFPDPPRIGAIVTMAKEGF